MSLKTLIELAPPPDKPVGIGDDHQWENVFRHLETRLPDDYIEFISLYGSGDFYNFLSAYNPFYSKGSLIDAIDTYHPMFENHSLCPPLFPRPGGLLLMGGEENGGLIFWRTEGEPSSWTITLTSDDFIDIEDYQLGWVDFLTAWLTRDIKPTLFEPWNVLDRPLPPFSPHPTKR